MPHSTPNSAQGPIRVITVDDSALFRLSLTRHLAKYPGIIVEGQGRNGKELLDLLPEINPDVVVLDVEMPEMNGLEALIQLMQEHPVPVVMLSNLTTSRAEVTLQALEYGAVDFVLKPQQGGTMQETVAVLVEKIRCAARTKVKKKNIAKQIAEYSQNIRTRDQVLPKDVRPFSGSDSLVVMASSTGGPSALTEFFNHLPGGLPIAGIIVQHMPAPFTKVLSQRLDRIGSYKIVEAEQGMPIQRGTFLVAPGGYHLTFSANGEAQLLQGAPVNGVCPAADVTMINLAEIYQSQVMAVILSGMGQDGLEGAKRVLLRGGVVLAQDQGSCVVYGMPRKIVEENLAEIIDDPVGLGNHIAVHATERIQRSIEHAS